MKKVLVAVIAVVILLALSLAFGRNIIARAIVIKGIKDTCGLNIDIAKLNIGLPNVSITGLKIYNPPGFTDKIMANIPEISVNFDFPAFLKNKVHLPQLTLDISELDIILNEHGKLNVNSLALLVPKPSGKKAPEIAIDELSVKIGKVAYKGYFPGAGEKAMEFNPNIDETLHDVTNPSKAADEILKKVLSRIGIANFANFDVGGVQKAVQDMGAAAKAELEKQTQGLKGLLNQK